MDGAKSYAFFRRSLLKTNILFCDANANRSDFSSQALKPKFFTQNGYDSGIERILNRRPELKFPSPQVSYSPTFQEGYLHQKLCIVTTHSL